MEEGAAFTGVMLAKPITTQTHHTRNNTNATDPYGTSFRTNFLLKNWELGPDPLNIEIFGTALELLVMYVFFWLLTPCKGI
jgi:hypothetical protein